MENETKMSKEQLGTGLRIEVCKNSIRFVTPEGKKYYKNFANFVEVLRMSNPTRSTFTFAPEDTGKPATAQQAVVTAITPAAESAGSSASV